MTHDTLAVSVGALWALWAALTVLLGLAASHRTGCWHHARALRVVIRWERQPDPMILWAADMRVLSEGARATIKWGCALMGVCWLWALHGLSPSPMMIEASLLTAGTVDGVLLVLLLWSLLEARLLRQLEAWPVGIGRRHTDRVP